MSVQNQEKSFNCKNQGGQWSGFIQFVHEEVCIHQEAVPGSVDIKQAFSWNWGNSAGGRKACSFAETLHSAEKVGNRC
jgi:hypothetical protein